MVGAQLENVNKLQKMLENQSWKIQSKKRLVDWK